MSAITTHVLDTARGRPAVNIPVLLERREGSGWHKAGEGATNPDGRFRALESIEPGEYRMIFDVASYLGEHAFYRQITIQFRVTDAAQHHHVPLLLSPFGYSTYRGS